MAFADPGLVSTGDVATASWANIVRNSLRYSKGSDGAVTVDSALSVTGALAATGILSLGSGVVALTDATGKIVAIDATHFANLSGANLTGLPSGQLSGALPAIDGSALTALNASNLGSGSVPSARLTTVPSSALFGSLPAISGVALTSLNANALNNPIPVNKLPSSLFLVSQATSVPNNGWTDISVDNTRCGFVMVTEQNGAYGSALFSILGTGNGSALTAGSTTRYDPNLGTASKINCGYSGSVYRVENKTGGTVVVDIVVIGFI